MLKMCCSSLIEHWVCDLIKVVKVKYKLEYKRYISSIQMISIV